MPADKAAEIARVRTEAVVPKGGARQGLTREHLEALRAAGATRADVREVAEELFGDRSDRRGNLVELLMGDLDSYGAWEGD